MPIGPMSCSACLSQTKNAWQNVNGLTQSDVTSSCHENSPMAGSFSAPGGLDGANTAKTAPCGSARTAERPMLGMSLAAATVRPPSEVACFTVASTSGTVMCASQCGGAPLPWPAGTMPPIGTPLAVNIVYFSSSHCCVPQPATFE